MQTDLANVKYATFGDRFMAFLLDNLMLALLLSPLFWILLRADFEAAMGDPFALAEQVSASMSSLPGYLINYGGPLLYFVLFWIYKSGTPGKLMLDMTIVNATTGGKPSAGRLVVRYIGYYVNVFTCLIGFFWIAFDKRGQGLHDKMANTIVIVTTPKRPPENSQD